MQRTVLLFATTLLVSCVSSPTPQYDARFGDAVRQSRQAHVLHPQPAPVAATTMDAKALREATGRYHDSFKAPPQPTTVINIGGGLATGGR